MAQHIAKLALAGAIGLSMLVGCGPQATSQTTTQPSPASSASVTPVNTTPAAVSFASTVTPLMQSRCASCHTEGRGGAARAVQMFTAAGAANHAEVSAKIGQMIAATESGRMPLGGPKLTPAEIQVFKDWQAAGTPNN
jgi:mono/diheme cytochrome c family protein